MQACFVRGLRQFGFTCLLSMMFIAQMHLAVLKYRHSVMVVSVEVVGHYWIGRTRLFSVIKGCFEIMMPFLCDPSLITEED